MLRNIGYLILLLTLALSQWGCSHGGEGDPAGGTSLPTSTHDEIRAATYSAKEFLIENNVFWNLARNFDWENSTNPKDQDVRPILDVMGRKVLKVGGDKVQLPKDRLKKIPIIFSENDCVGGPQHKVKDASVTENSFSGKICISLNRIARFTAKNLKENMLIILAHEYAHIFGYGEMEADKISAFFTENISTVMTEDNGYLREQVVRHMLDAHMHIEDFVESWELSFKPVNAEEERNPRRNPRVRMGRRIDTKPTEAQFYFFFGSWVRELDALNSFVPFPNAYPQMVLDEQKFATAINSLFVLIEETGKVRTRINPHNQDENLLAWDSPEMLAIFQKLRDQSAIVKQAMTDYLGTGDPKMKPYKDRLQFLVPAEELEWRKNPKSNLPWGYILPQDKQLAEISPELTAQGIYKLIPDPYKKN